MYYPTSCPVFVDVTKPPYNADNTGKTDCTASLCQALNDILQRNIDALDAFYEQVKAETENFTLVRYYGFEAAHTGNGRCDMTFPLHLPPTRILYLPAGTYLVSDTVCYTLDNLQNKHYFMPTYECNYNIHIWGEDSEKTVITLADNAKGFEKGARKPIISLFRGDIGDNTTEKSNISFSNEIKNLTVDTGSGNDGAIGIRYHSSNCGRMENIHIKGSGVCGAETVFGSQATFDTVKIDGFDYGFDINHSTTMVLDNIDFSGCRIAGIRTYAAIVHVNAYTDGSLPLFDCQNGGGKSNGVNYVMKGRLYTPRDCKVIGDGSSDIFHDTTAFAADLRKMPRQRTSYTKDDIAFVDDYGAVGDGKTDSTYAVEKAVNSGKAVVIFGYGQYCINGFIHIPASVEVIDFLYCDLAAGPRLIGGEVPFPFVIDGESKNPLFVRNILTWEQYYGHCHLFGHACKRPVVFANMQVFMSHLYVNTVPGGTVYFDNCFSTTGTYIDNSVINRGELVPVYSAMVPYEFHGQTVYGRQVNLERANIAILNDNSRILLDGYRTEGYGTAMKITGGGISQVNVFNAGIGRRTAENPLFDVEDGLLDICGVNAFGYNKETMYNTVIKDGNTVINRENADAVTGFCATVKRYRSKQQ